MEKRTLFMAILSVVLIGVLLSLAYYKNQQAKFQQVLLWLTVDQSCDLQKSDCTLKWLEGEVTLSITPRPIPLVKPIQIVVQLKSRSASEPETNKIQGVTVDFKGTTMNMGPNNVKLTKSAPNVWTGSGMLPVCIRNQMEWQADVYLQTEQGIIIAPFIFLTRKQY